MIDKDLYRAEILRKADVYLPAGTSEAFDLTPQPVREMPTWLAREGWLTLAARARRRRRELRR